MEAQAIYKASPVRKWKKRIIARKGNEHLIIKLDDISLVLVSGRVVFVFDKNGNKYLSDKNLQLTLEELDPEVFFRVNRQAVVSLHYIKSYKIIENSKVRIELTINGIPNGLIVSQERTSVFKSWIAGEVFETLI